MRDVAEFRSESTDRATEAPARTIVAYRVRVTANDHKSGNDAMKSRAVVQAVLGQTQEVASMIRCNVGKDFDVNNALRCVQFDDIESGAELPPASANCGSASVEPAKTSVCGSSREKMPIARSFIFSGNETHTPKIATSVTARKADPYLAHPGNFHAPCSNACWNVCGTSLFPSLDFDFDAIVGASRTRIFFRLCTTRKLRCRQNEHKFICAGLTSEAQRRQTVCAADTTCRSCRYAELIEASHRDDLDSSA